MKNCIVGIDPGLDIFGYCIIEIDSQDSNILNNGRLTYITSGRIATEPGEPTISRARRIIGKLTIITSSLPSKEIYVLEKPNECLYGLNQDRVSGVLKLFSVIYCIIGSLSERNKVAFTITPDDWQLGKTELKKANMSVKKWSRWSANRKLTNLQANIKELRTKDQDIADAVNICVYGVRKLTSGDWVL